MSLPQMHALFVPICIFSIIPFFFTRSARSKLERLYDCKIITVVMYLPAPGARKLFLAPPLKEPPLDGQLEENEVRPPQTDENDSHRVGGSND